jgi:hypothetical protein
MHLNSCCDRLWNASTEARRDPCQAPCVVVNRALGLLGLDPQRALWAALPWATWTQRAIGGISSCSAWAPQRALWAELPWAKFLRRIVGGASVFPNATMRSVKENKRHGACNAHGEAAATIDTCASNQSPASRRAPGSLGDPRALAICPPAPPLSAGGPLDTPPANSGRLPLLEELAHPLGAPALVVIAGTDLPSLAGGPLGTPQPIQA